MRGGKGGGKCSVGMRGGGVCRECDGGWRGRSGKRRMRRRSSERRSGRSGGKSGDSNTRNGRQD